MIGAKIAHYEITAKLGEGGMGVVYRATDTKLNREVAIKLLPEQLAHDSERMERFRREAQVLAQLNHPAIAGIYGVEDAGDSTALVMELAEGETLAERLASGLPRLDDALPIARQIAGALEAARPPPEPPPNDRRSRHERRLPRPCDQTQPRRRHQASARATRRTHRLRATTISQQATVDLGRSDGRQPSRCAGRLVAVHPPGGTVAHTVRPGPGH